MEVCNGIATSQISSFQIKPGGKAEDNIIVLLLYATREGMYYVTRGSDGILYHRIKDKNYEHLDYS